MQFIAIDSVLMSKKMWLAVNPSVLLSPSNRCTFLKEYAMENVFLYLAASRSLDSQQLKWIPMETQRHGKKHKNVYIISHITSAA